MAVQAQYPSNALLPNYRNRTRAVVSGAGDNNNNNNRNNFLSSSSPLNFNQSSFFDEFQFHHPHLLPAATTTGGGSNPLRAFNHQRVAAAPSFFWPKKLHWGSSLRVCKHSNGSESPLATEEEAGARCRHSRYGEFLNWALKKLLS